MNNKHETLKETADRLISTDDNLALKLEIIETKSDYLKSQVEVRSLKRLRGFNYLMIILAWMTGFAVGVTLYH